MSYLRELRVNWRPLSAAAIGLGSGLLLNAYIAAIFAPHLLAEFGWSKSSFALIGAVSLIMLFCLPVIGRLTDLFGVKRIATVGVATVPLMFIALSFARGDIREYVAILLVQTIVGATTSSTVYTRLVAERFARARGLALALAACGPPLIGAVGGPILNDFIDSYGWRAAYRALAAFTFVLGLIALAMIPVSAAATTRVVGIRRRAAQDYPLIVRSAAFWLISIGMFLCNLPQTLHGQQMMLLLLENGATSATASIMISVYAVGVMVGRFACGLALDRLPTHWVAAVCMGLPSVGLILIASAFDASPVLAFAMLLIGFSQGAEGDVLAYVVARYFGIEIYSSVFGLLTAILSGSTACGAFMLAFILKLTDTFTPFVLMGAVTTSLGSILLLVLGRVRTAGAAVASHVADGMLAPESVGRQV